MSCVTARPARQAGGQGGGERARRTPRHHQAGPGRQQIEWLAGWPSRQAPWSGPCCRETPGCCEEGELAADVKVNVGHAVLMPPHLFLPVVIFMCCHASLPRSHLPGHHSTDTSIQNTFEIYVPTLTHKEGGVAHCNKVWEQVQENSVPQQEVIDPLVIQ